MRAANGVEKDEVGGGELRNDGGLKKESEGERDLAVRRVAETAGERAGVRRMAVKVRADKRGST